MRIPLNSKDSGATHTRDVNRIIEKILSEPPATEGGRHADMLNRSLQLIGNGWDDESCYVAMTQLYPIGSGSSRKVTEKEIRDIIRGAHALNPTPTGESKHYQRLDEPKARKYEHDGTREELPSDEIKMSYSEYIVDVLGFRQDECVWFAGMEEDLNGNQRLNQWPEATTIDKIAGADKAIGGEGFTQYGSFYCVNPIKPGGRRKENDVSRYLYTMIESDDLPKEEQLAIFRKSGLPIKALVHCFI
jgi:hypothetical protein